MTYPEQPLRYAQAFEDDEGEPEEAFCDVTEPGPGVKVTALQSYTSLLTDHLTFKTGQNIKQKRSANADGLAYGYIMKNKYTRKKMYGFYPANLVAVIVPDKAK